MESVQTSDTARDADSAEGQSSEFDVERERNELKSKIEELETYRTKYEQQVEENGKLQKKVDQMFLNQSDSGQKLVKANDILDKLRTDNKKKTDQIEKNQRDMRYMEDRIRNLEIRASEVEKAELILDTTKSNLEATVQQVRARESDIRRLNRTNDDTCKQLEMANKKLKVTDDVIHDLKVQVRHELMKNENIEKNLETIPRLKDTIKDKENELQAVNKDLEEKTALLAASRKSARENRDKIRVLEKVVTRTETMEYELEIAQCEVTTLKRLMQGKDCLVIQKSKALDIAKDVIHTMKQSTEKDQMSKIVALLERIGNGPVHHTSNGNTSEIHSNENTRPNMDSNNARNRSHGKTDNNRNITVNKPPYPQDTDSQPYYRQRPASSTILNELVLNDVFGSNEDLRNRTAVVRPTVKRSASYKEPRVSSAISKHSYHQSESSRNSDVKYGANTSLETYEGTIHSKHCSYGPRSPRQPSSTWGSRSRSDLSLSDLSSMSSDGTGVEERPSSACLAKLAKLSLKEKEDVYLSVISVGARVLVSVPQKPPRYGKKITPKPKIYTGIVKYTGTLDKPGYDPRTFVGVRLDDTDGDNDGMYKGKRYMYTPTDQGKFYKLLDVTSVLDVQIGKYRKLSSIVSKHVMEHS